jgi:hypothetical protein
MVYALVDVASFGLFRLCGIYKSYYGFCHQQVDRLYGWKTCPNAPIRNALKVQSKDVVGEFEQRLAQVS